MNITYQRNFMIYQSLGPEDREKIDEESKKSGAPNFHEFLIIYFKENPELTEF